jgi:hypothetical protein
VVTYMGSWLIKDSAIHLYFVGKQLQEALVGPSYPMSCPQCPNTSFAVGNFKLAHITAGLKDGYAPLLDQNGEPRGSVEEGGAIEDGEMV